MQNDNFEQQFTQKVKANIPPVGQSNKQYYSSLAIMVVIVVFLIVQLILSFIILVKVSSSTDYEYEEVSLGNEPSTDSDDEVNNIYDDNDYLVAMNATCKSDDGTVFSLTKEKTYQKISADSIVSDTGTYSITRGSVFEFVDSKTNKSTLFYDGFALTDGTTFYDCTASTPAEETTE